MTIVRPVMTGIAAVVLTVNEGVITVFREVRDPVVIPNELVIVPELVIPLELITPQLTFVETLIL